MTRLIPIRITAPAALVSVDDLKAHLRIDHADDDALLGSIRDQVESELDGYDGRLGRCLLSQRWRVDFCAWPCGGVFALPLPPQRQGTFDAPSVKYIQLSDGSEQVLDPSMVMGVYDSACGAYLRLSLTAVLPNLALRPDAVRVEYACGYGEAAHVPSGLKGLIKVMVAEIYQNPDAVTVKDLGNQPYVDRILANYRVPNL